MRVGVRLARLTRLRSRFGVPAATRQQRLADVHAKLHAGISAERRRLSDPRKASAYG
jgi:hypothetical protein